MAKKKIAVLGSTGAIGTRTLQVAKHLGFEVVAIAARANVDLLEVQAHAFSPKCVALYEEGPASVLRGRLPHIPVFSGVEGLEAIASFEEADFIMLAMSGSVGMIPAIAAIHAGKQIGLANKEVMISAGELVVNLAKKRGVDLIPVDSEHSALFQCLKGESIEQVRRLILTASGGPFFRKSIKELSQVAMDALYHPHFQMGPKALVDSSTLMNKGFEMIEAKWLYGIDPGKIEALIHPEQQIQSCVEFIDGAILAQISQPDMLLPIQYALTYPKRTQGLFPPYDFIKNGPFTFFEPDKEKFRCLKLAIEAMGLGKSYPCFLNAANEVLVERFLKKKISWIEIGEKLEKLISSHDPENLLTLEAILEVDKQAREKASIA